MKSSLNPNKNYPGTPDPTSWRPADFSASVKQDASSAEAIQRIFQMDEVDSLQNIGRMGVNKANPNLSLAGWQPGEFRNQPATQSRVVRRFAFEKTNQALPGEEKTAAQPQKFNEESFVMAEAQMKAADVLTRALASAEEMTHKGYLEGIEKGKAELASTLDAADQLIDQLHSMENEILANSEVQVLDLVKDIARSMFGNGINLDGRALHEAFGQALVNARSLGNLKVYLNPKDAVNMDPNWRDDQAYISGQKMHFIPSEDIKPGGCYVIGEQGSVDARIDTKLASILKVLTRYEDHS
jgi:flagellar biosynthesis/type III secretory pathway protein FliH